ncbi:MAG: hypothetical protein AB1403_02450 [Candidatus Riflebacteria bacterium]
MYRSNGFSLPEIILGIFIFTGVILIFTLSVSSSTKESAFSANHFTSLMLGQKVSEDIIEEFAINPFANESLILDHGQARKESVIDGGSAFFITIDDQHPPWGKIDSSSDGAISEKIQPLFEQVSGYQLITSSHNQAFGDFQDETTNLQKVSVEFFWKTGQQKGNILREFYVFSPKTGKKTQDKFPEPDFSSKTFEGYFKLFFPRNNSRTINEIINQYEIDGRIAFEYASVVDAYEKLMQSSARSKLNQEITASKKIFSNTTDVLSRQKQNLKLAKAYLQLSRIIFLTFGAAINHLKTVTDSHDAVSTINKMSAQQVFLTHQKIAWLNNYFLTCLEETRKHYIAALRPDNSGLLSKKEEQQIILRLIDIYRIFLISSPATQQAPYKSFLMEIKKYAEWRNMFLFRFICQEELLIRDISLLISKFPNIGPVEKVLNQSLKKVKTFILQHR